jgi:hypothetical protein
MSALRALVPADHAPAGPRFPDLDGRRDGANRLAVIEEQRFEVHHLLSSSMGPQLLR